MRNGPLPIRKISQNLILFFSAPDNFNADLEHFGHFFEGVRNGTPVMEDPVFGFRAAAPCLAANESYFRK